jgi:hypothetical protein
MDLVKIYDMYHQEEKIMARGVALNRLKNAHFEKGGRWCAVNEKSFFSTPAPEPELPEAVEKKYDLPPAKLAPEPKPKTETSSVAEAVSLPTTTKQVATPSKRRIKKA